MAKVSSVWVLLEALVKSRFCRYALIGYSGGRESRGGFRLTDSYSPS
jgi:hypothetical protein